MSVRGRLSLLARDARGFTIVETMVAIAIMAVAFLGLAGVNAISSRAQALGQNRGLARFVADEQLEHMRRLPFDGIVAESKTVPVQGVQFTMAQTVAVVPMGRRVSVTVSWLDPRFSPVPQAVTLTTIVSQVTNPAEA